MNEDLNQAKKSRRLKTEDTVQKIGRGVHTEFKVLSKAGPVMIFKLEGLSYGNNLSTMQKIPCEKPNLPD